MTTREILGLAGILFLAAFVFCTIVLNRRGRKLALRIEVEQPDVYQDLGRPLPTTLPSERRTRFDEFLKRKDYETLLNPDLSRSFARLRRFETRLLGLAVIVLLLLAGAMLGVD